MSAKTKKPPQEQGQVVPATTTVTVEVINQPLYEADAYRAKGERFELPAARAAVLTSLVRIIKP